MNKQEIFEKLYPLIEPVEKKVMEIASTREELDTLCGIIAGHFIYAITHDKSLEEREKEFFRLRQVDDRRHGGVFIEKEKE